MDDFDASHEKLTKTIDKFLERRDVQHAKALADQDRRIAYIGKCIDLIAEKTGIDLNTAKL